MEFIQEGDNGSTEPVAKCPKCGNPAYADWVSVLSRPFEVQVSPFHCYVCGWTQSGCPSTNETCDNCKSFDLCRGKSRKQVETVQVSG